MFLAHVPQAHYHAEEQQRLLEGKVEKKCGQGPRGQLGIEETGLEGGQVLGARYSGSSGPVRRTGEEGFAELTAQPSLSNQLSIF